jgi:RNA recognition motif-containing protein
VIGIRREVQHPIQVLMITSNVRLTWSRRECHSHWQFGSRNNEGRSGESVREAWESHRCKSERKSIYTVRYAVDDVVFTFSSFSECRGFGFVTFSEASEAENAIKELTGTEIRGRKITVEIAKRSAGYPKSPGQYLGHNPVKGRRDRRRSRSGSRE